MPKVLLGFMGVGKTSVANCLENEVIDLDSLIEKHIGMSISQFFTEEGEASFRALESQFLNELLKKKNEGLVIASGGGIVLLEENRRLLTLNRHNNILLTGSFEVLYHRIKKDEKNRRPLFLNHSKEEFYDIYQKRMLLYSGLSDMIIDTDHLTPQKIATVIGESLVNLSN